MKSINSVLQIVLFAILISTVATFIITYVAASFISLSFNPLKWYLGVRIAVAIVGLGFTVYSTVNGLSTAETEANTEN